MASPLNHIDSCNGNSITVYQSTKESVLKPLKKKDITILLVGETGSGKTSFLSLLINLFMGNQAQELVDWHDPRQEFGGSQSQSQTDAAVQYEITTLDKTLIRIIDTPGLADTRGGDKDAQHMKAIYDRVQAVPFVDAVLLVVNGAVPRSQSASRYAVSSIRGMFPRSIGNNIGLILTNCDVNTVNVNVKEGFLKNLKPTHIQNPLAILKNQRKQPEGLKQGEEPLDSQEDQDTPDPQEQLDSLKASYDSTVKTINKLFAWIDSREAQPTTEIDEIRKTTARIEAQLQLIVSDQPDLMKKKQELQKLERELTDAKSVKEAYEATKAIQMQPRWVRVDDDQPNVICTMTDCHSNCHEGCRDSFIYRWREFVGITAPTDATVCDLFSTWFSPAAPCPKCGHYVQNHTHVKSRHTNAAGEVDPLLAKQLQGAATDQVGLEILRDSNRLELAAIQAKIDDAPNQIRNLVEQYRKLSLNPDYAGHINNSIEMLKQRKKAELTRPNSEESLKTIDGAINMLQTLFDVVQGSK